MQEYPVGTIEYFVVEVTDRLDNLASLDPYTVTFDVKSRLDGTVKYTNQVAAKEEMKIKCLIDTAGWELGVYLLWATILATPESPRLGPFEFRVID